MGTYIAPREHKLHLGAPLATLQGLSKQITGESKHTHENPCQLTPVHPSPPHALVSRTAYYAGHHQRQFQLSSAIPQPSNCHSTNPGLEIVILRCKFASRAVHGLFTADLNSAGSSWPAAAELNAARSVNGEGANEFASPSARPTRVQRSIQRSEQRQRSDVISPSRIRVATAPSTSPCSCPILSYPILGILGSSASRVFLFFLLAPCRSEFGMETTCSSFFPASSILHPIVFRIGFLTHHPSCAAIF